MTSPVIPAKSARHRAQTSLRPMRYAIVTET